MLEFVPQLSVCKSGVLIAAILLAPVAAEAGAPISDWGASHESRARLVAGKVDTAAGGAVMAGIELELNSGWKTYWRNPGDAGGVPPAFDLTGSENVKASVLYPAPHRFTDQSGETVGYKNGVTFPLQLEIADPSRPAKLRVHLEYGICREICIPSEADLALDIAPGLTEAAPAGLNAAIAHVPRRDAGKNGAGPALVSAKSILAGEKPRIAFEVAYPAAAEGADAFVEGPSGVYVPLPHRVAIAEKNVSYEIDLAGVDLADLKGKDVVLTLVGEAGSSEVSVPVR